MDKESQMSTELRLKIQQTDTSLFVFEDHEVTKEPKCQITIHPTNVIPPRFAINLAYQIFVFSESLLRHLLKDKTCIERINKAILKDVPIVIISLIVKMPNKLYFHYIYTWYKHHAIMTCGNHIVIANKNILRRYVYND